MEENLIGYLLCALDPGTEREVDAYLQADPDGQKNLDLLRQALKPLEADRDELEPPATLRVRTLALVAEHRCRVPAMAPKAPPVRQAPLPRSWWRRADVLVAASILFLLLPLIPPGLNYLRIQRNIIDCKNNLRGFYYALMAYSDHHERRLPLVEENPPRNYAGFVVPILRSEGLLGTSVSVTCPSNGFSQPSAISLETLDEDWKTRPEQFEQEVRRLAGCYAYSLGYRESGRHFGLRYDPQQLLMPVMADRPPFEQKAIVDVAGGNSLNHGGTGQNVLFLGGNVAFCTSRNVGPGGDDIYLNKLRRPEAGIDRMDAVLGASNFKPYPDGTPPEN